MTVKIDMISRILYQHHINGIKIVNCIDIQYKRNEWIQQQSINRLNNYIINLLIDSSLPWRIRHNVVVVHELQRSHAVCKLNKKYLTY